MHARPLQFRKKRRRRALFIIWIVAIVAAVLTQYADELPNWNVFLNKALRPDNLVATAMICLGIILIIDWVHRKILPRFRRSPLLVAAPVAAVLYLVAIVASFTVAILFFGLIYTRSITESFSLLVNRMLNDGIWVGITFGFTMALVVTFTLEFSRRIGPGRILSWLLGRYRSPKEETRAFLLIDLRNSTPLAEKLGTIKFSYLLQDFFSDLAFPVADTGGEIVSYVGDEAIIYWPVDLLKKVNPLDTVAIFQDALLARTAYYSREYGLVPEFKSAFHVGPVVATEVGEMHTVLVFHGDALNTASRVLGLCNELGSDLLVTEEALPHLSGDARASLDRIGEFSLRGKGEPMSLHTTHAVASKALHSDARPNSPSLQNLESL